MSEEQEPLAPEAWKRDDVPSETGSSSLPAARDEQRAAIRDYLVQANSWTAIEGGVVVTNYEVPPYVEGPELDVSELRAAFSKVFTPERRKRDRAVVVRLMRRARQEREQG